MGHLSKIKDRLSRKIKKRPDAGAEQGGGVSSSPSPATPDLISTFTTAAPASGPVKTSPITTTTAQPSPEQAAPLAPNPASASPISVPQPTVSDTPSTSDDADLWTMAYELAQEREPELMADYNKHLQGNTTASANLSNREWVKSIVNELLEDRKEKQWRVSIRGKEVTVQEQVQKLAEFIRWSDPIIREAVSTQPYAALAWSGVSLFLPLLTSGVAQNKAMLEGFNSISDLQMYWRICEETYLQSEHRRHYQALIEPLAKLYSYIMEYQARVICHLSTAQLRRAWRDMAGSNDWAGTREKINTSHEDCSRFVPIGEQEEIRQKWDEQLQGMQKLLQTLKEDKRDEKETQLLHDLAAAAEGYERYKNINPERVPGTCEWFLTDEKFCKWRDSESPSLLWVSAGPGRGKSVLSKSLIDEGKLTTDVTTITITPHAIMNTTSAVCYFFFKDGGEGRMDGAHALCAILHQLFTCPSTSRLIEYALPSHRENGPTLTKKFSELWGILEKCATSLDAGDIICVLDALDECNKDSRQEIIEILEKFYSPNEKPSNHASKLKFLVTSRPYDDLEHSFQKIPATAAYLHFDGEEKSEQIGREINLVIDARVQDVTVNFTADDQRKISERLKSMEHRTYLWLHLTFDIIKRKRADYGKRSDIERLLSHLPSQVSDAYEKILSRSTDRRRTEILLQIVLAAARPLTLDEANIALTLAVQEERLASHAALKEDLWPESNFRSVVTNLCGLFISVFDSKLSFIHQTAREFLTDSKQEGSWKGRFNMPQSHSTISRSCLYYLLLPDIDRPVEDSPAKDKQHLYLAYAAAHWPLHFVSQEVTDADLFRKDARTLCNIAGHQASIWVPSYLKQRKLQWEGWTDLALASYLGLKQVVQDILFKEKTDVDIRGGDYSTALVAALAADDQEFVKNRHEAIVKLLLEKGADIETKDEYGRTPLSLAARNGHEAMVKLLLEKGADTETKDKYGQTPLSWAAMNGHEAVVKLLLEKGADIETKDEYGQTPLSWAAGSGHEAIGADIETKDESGLTPLLCAAGNGHEAMVKLLLEKGADTETKDESGRTLLSWAARNGHEAVVRFLESHAIITSSTHVDLTSSPPTTNI
ncbi:hypothetical protein QBC33DRAFT_546789 [Phialemonium atrogriseum]|uniref:NWD NACHT-NTPase N-terminal domain-containing protein n=1 Tax=Phialemonium atrogriseum TaxID=1093897 RepID=A0AAJ0FL23_9PEZI|nr:uncharacterized protein QBC33DRAFT_546789 [Phialemonium atrogriseum]KAK1764670.1 hypothetical protein QBC33DRAFT_546789 [Phialemonium atrogriseum]